METKPHLSYLLMGCPEAQTIGKYSRSHKMLNKPQQWSISCTECAYIPNSLNFDTGAVTSAVSRRGGSCGPATAEVQGCPLANSTHRAPHAGPATEGVERERGRGCLPPTGQGHTPHPAPHHQAGPQSTLKPYPKPVTHQKGGEDREDLLSPPNLTQVPTRGGLGEGVVEPKARCWESGKQRDG